MNKKQNGQGLTEFLIITPLFLTFIFLFFSYLFNVHSRWLNIYLNNELQNCYASTNAKIKCDKRLKYRRLQLNIMNP